MPKKKILFIMPYLGCGGVETTFFSLLENWDRKTYDITLLLLENKGALSERIPADIQVKYIVLPEREWGVFYGKKNVLKRYLKKGKIWKIPAFLAYNRRTAITEDRTQNAAYFDRISDSIPRLEDEYDLAIDYFGYATFTTFYLAEKVTAKVKVSFVHSIFSRFTPQAFEKWYLKMDKIFACSLMVKQDFERIFPSVQTVELFYNIISPSVIREKALMKGGFEDDYKGVRILTVGRICHEKGMDMAIGAFQRLLQVGYDIRWYFVGAVDETYKETLLKTLLPKEYAQCVFLGIQKNPYPFIKQCDIYVQPSRFEGFCTTTNEARILGKPIVMTDVSGAREQLKDGETGFVVEKNVDAIYEGVKKLLDDVRLRELFSYNLQYVDCDTRKETEKLDAILCENE